jgi:hypothetical protein
VNKYKLSDNENMYVTEQYPVVYQLSKDCVLTCSAAVRTWVKVLAGVTIKYKLDRTRAIYLEHFDITLIF